MKPVLPVNPEEFHSIERLVAAHAIEPDRTAILFEGTTISYRDLVLRAGSVAQALGDIPVRRGDRVAILASNSPAYLISYLAVVERGAILVPIHVELSAPEIAYILAHAAPALILCDQALRPKLDAALRETDTKPPVLLPDWCGQNTERRASATNNVAPLNVETDDVVLVCYTSGTTASPKGVAASHRVEIASASGFGKMWKLDASDLVTVALPLSTLFGLHTASFVALAHGATILLLPRFNPVRVLEAMQSRRATVFLGVPTMYSMMLEHVRQTGKQYDLSSVRLAVASGAPLSGALKKGFHEAFGIDIVEYYALSEVRPVFSPDLGRAESVPAGSVGRLAPNTDVRIVGEDGRSVAPGEIGELIIRAPSMMKAYFRDPQRTAASMRDGWFWTGDLARKDLNDFYYIVGRTRDQIISGGAKIAPAEVEDALLRHPGVEAAAVIGVPDDAYGQLVKAVVVLRPDVPVTAEELKAYSKQRLAEYKVPKIISFVPSLPIGPTGKILKRALS
jgi:long-chain acyl-CoA synthetase